MTARAEPAAEAPAASSWWTSARGELRVFARTFSITWPLLAAALCAWITSSAPAPAQAGDLLFGLAFGFALCLVYAFWPALITAIARLAFRLIGWGALLPLPLIALGLALALWLGEGWLQERLSAVFAAMNGMGPCAAHVGGQSLPLALSCMALALLHPHGLVAVAALSFALLCLIVLGAGPGILLALVLIVRALRRRWARAR